MAAIKRVQKCGVLVVAVALLGMCRPASATELMFSFTAATLENIFSTTAGFGAGDCGTASQVTTMCGIYTIELTPNLANATMVSISSPIPTGTGAWDAVGQSGYTNCTLGTTGCNQAYWYADFSTPSDPDPYVTFLTQNTLVATQSFSLFEGQPPFSAVTVTGTAPMPGSDAFTFAFTTTVEGVTVNNVSFELDLTAVSLNSDGTQGDKQVYYGDTNFSTPEPPGSWLCLLGLAVLGVSKKWRWLVAGWNHRA